MGTTRRKKRRRQNDRLVLKLLILVAAVLFIFEGKLIYTMFTHNKNSAAVTAGANASNSTDSTGTTSKDNAPADKGAPADPETGETAAASAAKGGSVMDELLAGLSSAPTGADTGSQEPMTEDSRISEEIDSPAVVPKQDTPVDDSFFANSVFIGDSRMMGFRNSSGITQGTFLTSVGLSTDAMSEQVISTAEGNISVYQGLSGEQYDKIYLMLGTNDLGYYPWEDFKPHFSNIIQQFHKLQPDATIYVCSVIYVDEAQSVTSYNNNDNVRKVNGYQLEVCEEEDYCYYLNLNEIFTNGHGGLLEGASSDGIHLYEEYCKQMLTYLKNHYVTDTQTSGQTDGGTNADSRTKEASASTETGNTEPESQS